MSAYLQIDHLSKTFTRGSQETEVLHDITLTVMKGDYVSIIGHSGCGKSTLLNIVAGLVPSTTGGVLVENREVNEPGPDRAVVFQNHSLLPWLTVYDNVSIAVNKVFGGKKSRAERHDWVMHNLDLVQMGHAKDKRPAEISGGMKQRAALARVLAFDPKVLLMDEPFGALDAQTRETMQEELTRLWERTGKTIVFVTHDIEEAVYLGDRVIVLSARPGRIREEVRIDLPRPRGLEIKKSAQCHEYRNLIWDLVRQESLTRRGHETD
jgi:nitrate/nitrite transport system ATP-binding protein